MMTGYEVAGWIFLTSTLTFLGVWMMFYYWTEYRHRTKWKSVVERKVWPKANVRGLR